MVDQRFVDPIEVPRTVELSQAVRVGNLIFCSGQIGIGPDGKIVDPRDTRAQIVRAFKNLKTVLDGAGESLDQVVKITSYLLDDVNRDALVNARRRFFKPPYPASTLVVVKGLARPDYRYAIDAIAVVM